MDHLAASDSPPVYHGPESSSDEIIEGTRPPTRTLSLVTQDDLRELTGTLPRLFALIKEVAGDDDVVTETVSYGLSLPGGAAIVHADGRLIGRWSNAERAASMLGAYLVWLGESEAN
ncbi:hypothetical protein AB0K60_15625 [Thermopolyspora sp. NPDC052614]|uniref:hypothetical protein n=1 Tax=Thermopolyspora sp. NPDC052614 TaxID=3155682 RepID=UPI00344910C5